MTTILYVIRFASDIDIGLVQCFLDSDLSGGPQITCSVTSGDNPGDKLRNLDSVIRSGTNEMINRFAPRTTLGDLYSSDVPDSPARMSGNSVA
jgi:hypothetical protein